MVQNLPINVDGIQPKFLYNVDEIDLFYHLLLTRTLAFKGDNFYSGQNFKDQFTILFYNNAD